MNEATPSEMGQEAYDRGEFDLAASYYRQALGVKPHDYELVAELGSVYILQSKFEAAAKLYQDVIFSMERRKEDGEELGDMHIRLGETYLKLGDLASAQEQFETAGQLGANKVLLCEAQGNGYYALGQYDKALNKYKEFTHLAPGEQEGHVGKAKVYQRFEQYDLALESLKTAKALAPNDYWVEIAFGNLLMAAMDYNNALEHYKIARDLDLHQPAVLYSMGRAYLSMEDYDNAGKMFSAALERSPNDANSMYGLAQVEMLRGNGRQAIALLKSAIVINPSDTSYYSLLSQAQIASGRLLDALQTVLQERRREKKR